jgi:hypothetical protein
MCAVLSIIIAQHAGLICFACVASWQQKAMLSALQVYISIYHKY